MMSVRQMIILAVAYTVVVAIGVSFADVPGVVVFGVAFCWFSVGRMVGRGDEVPTRPIRWGRQR